MVPLNFGAAAPFKLKPHFEHVDAVSEFCVPQFGQNTKHLPQNELVARYARSIAHESASGVLALAGR